MVGCARKLNAWLETGVEAQCIPCQIWSRNLVTIDPKLLTIDPKFQWDIPGLQKQGMKWAFW